MALQDSFVAVDGAAVLRRIGEVGDLAVTRAAAAWRFLTPGGIFLGGLQSYALEGAESGRSTLSRVCQEIW